MFKNFIKTAFRNLWKDNTYSFLNIFGLAIGIACAGLIFLWTEDERNFDRSYIKKDRLYSVQINIRSDGNVYTMGSTPRPMGAALKAEIPGIVNAARVSDEPQRMLFTVDNKSLYAAGLYADASLFGMFTLPFVEGNATTAFSNSFSMVITESTARKFFGDQSKIVGRTVRIDNKQDYVITGILKDPPKNSTLQFEWLAPYQILLAQARARTGDNKYWAPNNRP